MNAIPITPESRSLDPIGPGAAPRAEPTPRLRAANAADLPSVNAVIERAVMTWKISERVKRLAMPTYRYDAIGFAHMQTIVAEDGAGAVVGVIACEPAGPRDAPEGKRGLHVHGIYVDPSWHRRGLGRRLFDAAAELAVRQGCDGLFVKAQTDAVDFFQARGLAHLPVVDPQRDYPHRFWLDLAGERAG